MKPVENEWIYIERHESEVPWLKIFTKRKIKEMSDATRREKEAIWEALEIIEELMLERFAPAKINIAQFGNYLPHLHWHIMARFEDDSFFPEPMWGTKQREGRAHPADRTEALLDALKLRLDRKEPPK